MVQLELGELLDLDTTRPPGKGCHRRKHIDTRQSTCLYVCGGGMSLVSAKTKVTPCALRQENQKFFFAIFSRIFFAP